MPESRNAQANPATTFLAEQTFGLPGAESLFAVGIGASAGGLEAFTKLVDALNPADGMAYILVQHLDPTHASMMADLLASHTPMPVSEAIGGVMIEKNHLYVIPPGQYLSVSNGALYVSKPQVPHGARLPFDFLLNSLAENYGSRAAAVILSGTGADGSLGVQAIKARGGLVIAQSPREAGFDGMPESAIRTGAVDFVLNVKEIPQKLASNARRQETEPRDNLTKAAQDWLPKIIELLRTRTAHDFRLYKTGTLLRRTEQRMMVQGIETDDMARYFEVLKSKPGETDLLAEDLLINVTNFFRDTKVFNLLETKIIPEMLHNRTPEQPVRIWVAGCSSGEETYSLAMLFREQISLVNQTIKLQIFASDVDADAVATAREGVYAATIETDIVAGRLARFFTREEQNYRVTPELRSCIVFAVQDVLLDPPFSRLDMVSCRNLLIYLRPEAQAKVLSIFHFGLRDGGILLLGSAETADQLTGRFEEIAKSERIYRHTGRSKPGDYGFLKNTADNFRVPIVTEPGQSQPRQAAYAELCWRMVIEAYAPAGVLINLKNEVLFSVGPTERYLRVVSGHPTHDLLAMAPQALRSKLRSAIQLAVQQNLPVAAPGGKAESFGKTVAFKIEVKPVVSGAEPLLLICFVDAPDAGTEKRGRIATGNGPKISELERELEITKAELQGAVRNLEISTEEQKAINEEALSVNEEHQSTNEELLTSKEELQSLNEELTALNSQLQETLERQRTTSNDLQNVLYSTDVATLFLDTTLKIRLFTPATKSLFSVIPGDIGRPLADLRSLAGDSGLEPDARQVLQTLEPLEREIEIPGSSWFNRRILPYRTQEDGVEGVVITYTDITERKATAKALGTAKQQADLANIAKSRFLAAASHDLRQPLQTLALLQGLLAKMVESEAVQKLVAMLDQTLGGMSAMLNTMLDINQIDAGSIKANIVNFPINDLLVRLGGEFAHHANAQGITLRFVPSSVLVSSDPHLLEQMIRNLLSNALKYTRRGKVLLGCRNLGDKVSIEVWDTGIGIPKEQLNEIFKEYHQLGNAARDRDLGVGLGLSIVQRLGDLLGHRVGVQSRSGRGSGFNIEVKQASKVDAAQPFENLDNTAAEIAEPLHRTGTILVIEDDPDVRALLEIFLKEEGHNALCFRDGDAALNLVQRGTMQPDLILADYNLPGGVNGVRLALRLREKLHREIPVIILTGDISTDTLREIASSHFVQLNKPVKLLDLAKIIQRHLPMPQTGIPLRTLLEVESSGHPAQPIIYIVDDDHEILETMRAVLATEGRQVKTYSSCEAFLEAYQPGSISCLLIDAYLPGMTGLGLLQKLQDRGDILPAIMMTGHSDVTVAVQAMKAGVSDFIEKPIGSDDLLASVNRALEQAHDSSQLTAFQASATRHMEALTRRQRQILDLILAGNPNKNIAADLGISQRTVETHRAAIMKKTGARSLPALARLALTATRTHN